MSAQLSVGFGFRRLATALTAAALMMVIPGCGSSDGTVVKGVPGSANNLKEEDIYEYSGKGRAKTKVFLTPQERRKLRNERANQTEQP